MNVAILSESPADEAALKVFVEAILGEPIESYEPHLRSRGFTSVLQVLPAVLKDLHYKRSADALVVVVDSDNSTIHQPPHETADSRDPTCRFCQIHSNIETTRQTLRPIPHLPQIKTAIAVPTPSIESWYLFGLDPDCTEAGWRLKQNSRISAVGEIRRLKSLAYGTDRPSLQLETAQAVAHANRVIADIDQMEAFFPNSFGTLASLVRGWT